MLKRKEPKKLSHQEPIGKLVSGTADLPSHFQDMESNKRGNYMINRRDRRWLSVLKMSVEAQCNRLKEERLEEIRRSPEVGRRRLFSVPEIAKLLNVSEPILRRWIEWFDVMRPDALGRISRRQLFDFLLGDFGVLAC